MDSSGLISPMAPRFGMIPLPNRGGSGGGGTSHRRSFSETFALLPDCITLDPEPDFDLSDIDFSSLSGEGGGKGMAAEASRPDPPATVGRPVPGSHLRSLSVDAAFFEGVLFQAMDEVGWEAERRGGHQRSGSMDGANSPFAGGSEFPQPEFANKAMPADKLAELALIDPKRAKKILANRQSAVRSKERKIRYTSELERKVQTLQIEATSLSAQLTLLQRSTTGLTVENRELKLRLQAMEQHAKLHEALNETLREEVQRLKSATGEIPSDNGNPFSISNQQTAPGHYYHSHRLHHSSKQAQHLQGSEAQACSKNRKPPRSPDDIMDMADHALRMSLFVIKLDISR